MTHIITLRDKETGEYHRLNTMPQYAIERLIGADDSLAEAPTVVECQLWDDDGELCATGTVPDDDECENQVAALRYGETCWGCTRIMVKRNGGWVQEIA